jgi:uncharacterized protein
MNACRLCYLAFLTATACSTVPEIHYYTLSPESATERIAVRAGSRAYVIDAIAIPDLLDRPQIVLRAGPNRIDVLDYNRWAAPLPGLLQRVLAADLAMRLEAGAILDPGLPPPAYATGRVTISIVEFNAGRDGQSVLDASWVISDGEVTPVRRSITTHRARHVASTNVADVAEMVATMNSLLPALADDIAATLARQE